jgi:molybdenum cofactor biosynthesis enzyme MoaA
VYCYITVCLFGNNEVSLRDAMRDGASDEELMVGLYKLNPVYPQP